MGPPWGHLGASGDYLGPSLGHLGEQVTHDLARAMSKPGPAGFAEKLLEKSELAVGPTLFQKGMQKHQNNQELLQILMASQQKQQEIMRRAGIM